MLNVNIIKADMGWDDVTSYKYLRRVIHCSGLEVNLCVKIREQHCNIRKPHLQLSIAKKRKK